MPSPGLITSNSQRPVDAAGGGRPALRREVLMPIGDAGAEIAGIAEIIRDLRPESRRDIDSMRIGDSLAGTAETPPDRVTRKRITPR